MKALPFALLAAAVVGLPLAAHAQVDEYKTSLPYRAGEIYNLNVYDINHDGKIDDWEREEVNFRKLAEIDLNHDGVIDKKDVKLAHIKARKEKEEQLAEIKKYDLNHDGKLDDHENELRLADEAKERAKQKPSAAGAELMKPMVGY